MKDITELAQSLKAAAIDAKELAIIARYSKGRAAAEKFYALANPNNTIALVEALEKAQQRIKEIESQRKLAFTASNRWADKFREAEKRIAELESRLESADKLQDSAFRSGLQHGFSLGQTDDQKGYEQSMAAHSPDAAIKWESA
ncbi:TPA: ead/Ea22-like family protein [Klebsiella michiganensis]|nr:ead/Ea22-like family protein [Klebsiella michiganensis]